MDNGRSAFSQSFIHRVGLNVFSPTDCRALDSRPTHQCKRSYRGSLVSANGWQSQPKPGRKIGSVVRWEGRSDPKRSCHLPCSVGRSPDNTLFGCGRATTKIPRLLNGNSPKTFGALFAHQTSTKSSPYDDGNE